MNGIFVVEKETKYGWRHIKTRHNDNEFFNWKKDAKKAIDNLEFPLEQNQLRIAKYERVRVCE